jgi:hypothetical protein
MTEKDKKDAEKDPKDTVTPYCPPQEGPWHPGAVPVNLGTAAGPPGVDPAPPEAPEPPERGVHKSEPPHRQTGHKR